MLIFYILFFIFGMVVGSFLNVVIIRLKTKESIFGRRSHCPFCKKKLNWYELIPVISFILQKAKCLKCKRKISWQYPAVELATGFAFMLILNYQLPIYNLQSFISTIFLLIISCFLIVIFVYDLKHYLVPDEIIYPAIALTFLYQLFRVLYFANWNLFDFWRLLLSALVGGAFFLIIVVISKGKWMGVGDVKIGILMGLLLGLSYLFTALFLAFLSGAIISGFLLAMKKKGLKSEIPFGPFLTGATFITLLWGDVLVKWYFNLFL